MLELCSVEGEYLVLAPRKDWDYLSRMRRLMREIRTGNPLWERGREMPMQEVQYLPTKLITKVVV